MKRISILLIVLIMGVISSCSFFNDANEGSGKRVARIGTHVLYESEIDKLMPDGISAEDSIDMVEQYINSWALKELMLRKAKSELTKNEKNINEEIEEFKRNIYLFRYEKLFIEERLDTVVTANAIKEYYEEHRNNFTVETSIVKGRAVRISENSPYFEMVKDEFERSGSTLSSDAKEQLISFSEKFYDFSSAWTPLSVAAKSIGIEQDRLESGFVVGSSYEISEAGICYLIYISDYVPAGEITPLDYNADAIRQIIISKRKQELLSTLEKDILFEATAKKRLKIYDE